MSPQNWLCRSERNPALDTLALNSPLVNFNGDNAYSPQIPDTQNYTVTCKVQFLQLQQCLSSKSNEHNPSHVQRHTLLSQPSQLLITQFRLNTHNPSRVLQHQKQSQYSMLQIKLISKNTFRPSPSYFFILLLLFLTTISEGPYKLSEETTQRKHTYVTPSPANTTKTQAKNHLLQNGSPSLNNNNHSRLAKLTNYDVSSQLGL